LGIPAPEFVRGGITPPVCYVFNGFIEMLNLRQ